MTLSIFATIYALIGCVGAERCDSGDRTCDESAADSDVVVAETDTGTGIDCDPTMTFMWDATGMTLIIPCGGSGTYSLGWVEASAFGWEGEDCLLGPGPSGNSGDVDVCHEGVSGTGITLRTVATPEEVVANKTTLMTETIANSGNLEWVLASNADGSCWTWGGGSYYSELDCAAM